MNSRFATLAYGNIALVIGGSIGALASAKTASAAFPVSLAIVGLSIATAFILSMFASSRSSDPFSKDIAEWKRGLGWALVPILIALVAAFLLRSQLPKPIDPDLESQETSRFEMGRRS